MKLTALRLHNIRCFSGRGIAIEGMDDGVNVLCAANEVGKSTCFDALHALFFQPHSRSSGPVRTLRPYSGGNSLVEADIVTDAGHFRLTKQFFGGKNARVTDLATGRLIAQADAAERYIGDLVQGNGGPAGLLWVRQGVTGLELRPKNDEETERHARETILSSLQGEVEVLTGGRRMLKIMAECEEELSRLVTLKTRAPRKGGPYASAQEDYERACATERHLNEQVASLRSALDRRRNLRQRLADLENPQDVAARRKDLADAQAAFDAANTHRQQLEKAEIQAAFARKSHDQAKDELERYRLLLDRLRQLRESHDEARAKRDKAIAHQQKMLAGHKAASDAVMAAETRERQARDLLMRLQRAEGARGARRELERLNKVIESAEQAQNQLAKALAAWRLLTVPEESLLALEEVEILIARLQAAEKADAPTLRVNYEDNAAQSIATGGRVLADGAELPLSGITELKIPTVGTVTVTVKKLLAGDELAEAKDRRSALLEQLKVPSLTEAHQRASQARAKAAEIEITKERLKLLAPEGIGFLREEAARLEALASEETEIEGDPAKAYALQEEASRELEECRAAANGMAPLIAQANDDARQMEIDFSTIEAERNGIEEQLGPEADRVLRESEYAQRLAQLQAPLGEAEQIISQLRLSAPDLENAEAELNRLQSAARATANEVTRTKVELGELTGAIRTRSEEAVEEQWREAVDACAVAKEKLERMEREVAVLSRLSRALSDARSDAHALYFQPVVRELRPLLGLLFDQAAVTFDPHSLLPQKLERGGMEENVEHLSGGMREQLSVLTRLAFARLLARDGRPAPVILDDALVYSDDDRIERMFNALHRLAKDQQIIAFSCRQRAFARLGGNILEMRNWTPQPM